MPGEDGGGLDDDEAGAPVGPEAGQPNPEDPVPSRQMGSDHGSLEDEELMAEGEVLEAMVVDPRSQVRKKVPRPITTIIAVPRQASASEPRLYRISGGRGEASSG